MLIQRLSLLHLSFFSSSSLPPPNSQVLTSDQHGSAEQHTGYAFSQNENTDSITQVELVRRYDTTKDKPEGD